MNISLNSFNFITPFILLLTYFSAFKNVKPTCDRYLINSFLYILSSLCIYISVLNIEKQHNLIQNQNRSLYYLIGLIISLLCLFAIFNTQNILLKHLIKKYLLHLDIFLDILKLN